MIDLANLRVRELLPDKLRGMDRIVGDQLGEIDRSLPRSLTGPVTERVSGAVSAALDLNPLAVIAGAWSKAREIEQYRGKPASGETITLFLAEHDLAFSLHPRVRLEFVGLPGTEITFELAIKAHVNVAELTIRAGHIVEVGRSNGNVSAQLRCGGVPLHQPLASRDFKLVSSHALPARGIAI